VRRECRVHANAAGGRRAPTLWNVTRAAPDVGELREDERVVELDPARARLTAIREPMALDLNPGRVFLSHSVQGRPVFGLKPDAAVVGPVQASTVGPLQVTTPTQEKSLTGSMYGSSEPHAMTEPLLDYLAGARLQPPRSLTGARFPLDRSTTPSDQSPAAAAARW
jgi:hypothetical protein